MSLLYVTILLLIAFGVGLYVTSRVKNVFLAILTGVLFVHLAQFTMGTILNVLFTHPILVQGEIPFWIVVFANIVIVIASMVWMPIHPS